MKARMQDKIFKDKLYRFRIPVGDWSGDGHSKVNWYEASASKPIEAVREAYFAAKEKLPGICPEDFCCDYEDFRIDPEIQTLLDAAGAPVESEGFGTEEMAGYVVWFLNQGDPDLKAKLEKEESVPMLSFYGYDEEMRHISSIGYGLLGD